MSNNIKKYFAVFSLVFSLFLATAPMTLVFAQNASPRTSDEARCEEFKKNFQIGNVNIMEGQPFFCSATDLILVAIEYLSILSGIITVLFLIIGGFWYVTSAGNDEQAEKGKKTLVNSVIGLVVITLAYTIVRIVSSTLHSTSR